MTRYLDKSAYKIGWICALPLEFAAAVEMLDQRHSQIPRDESDHNAYEFGRVGGHCNVIIAGLPSGVYGTNSAATVAANFRRSFPGITACLMVGIGGGAPLLPRNDIRLGDVVVGHPDSNATHGGVLQYNFGKTIQNGEFLQTGALNKPPAVLLGAITKLKADYLTSTGGLNKAIEESVARLSVPEKFARPDTQRDQLFDAHYDHPTENESCKQCDPAKVIERSQRSLDQLSAIWLIASGNQVMKYGSARDQLSRSKGVLCFEMEAAGIVDEIPTLVVRGICDYSDSHKNKAWQPYAALVAAVFARELLIRLPVLASNNTTGYTKDYECLRELGAVNPKDDKTRYESTKDSPIVESYSWILLHQLFQDWNSNVGKPVLWVSGDAGKGKTMLTMGVIDSLERTGGLGEPHQMPTAPIAYFFCQATDNRRNNAAAVLKGLLYHLISNDQDCILIKYLKEEFDKGGSSCFFGPNAFYVLQRAFTNILNHEVFPELYLIVDRLDECIEGLGELLHFILRSIKLSGSRNVKWFLTSRNQPNIEERLKDEHFQARISLEENSPQVSAAVNTYIKKKVAVLSKTKHYTVEIRENIENILREKSGGTFLWVHLACKELLNAKASRAVTALNNIPSGLSQFYKRMLDDIRMTNSEEDARLCHQVLCAVTLAVRPLSLLEMAIVAGLPRGMNEDELRMQVKECGSFLVIQNKTILFVHQTAKDFLDKHTSDGWDPLEDTYAHHSIVKSCIRRLSEDLKMDICDLKLPSFSTKNLNTEQTEKIIHLRYASCYWVSHVAMSKVGREDEAEVLGFLRKHLLHWLEVLILLGDSSRIVPLVITLEQTIRGDDETSKFLYDIRRFVRYNLAAIIETPLQLYHSALIFTPEESIVKTLFLKSRPDWISKVWGIDKKWGPLVQTLSTGCRINVIALSMDAKYLASTPTPSNSNGIAIWDVISGTLLKELEGHSRPVDFLAFSSSGDELASWSDGDTVRIWEVSSGKNTHIFPGNKFRQRYTGYSPYRGSAEAICFLLDSKLIACGSQDGSIRIWDTVTRKLLHVLKGPMSPIICLKASRDSSRLASLSDSDGTIRLWNVRSGDLLHALQCPELGGKGWGPFSVDFSPDGKHLVSGSIFSLGKYGGWESNDLIIRFWELASGRLSREQKFKLGLDDRGVFRVNFSLDGLQILFGVCNTWGGEFKIYSWSIFSGEKPTLLFDVDSVLFPFALSADLTQLVATEKQKDRPGIRQFDISGLKASPDAQKSYTRTRALALSPDGRRIAYITPDGYPLYKEYPRSSDTEFPFLMHLVDLYSDTVLWVSKFHYYYHPDLGLEFSSDGTILVLRAHNYPERFRFWDTASGTPLDSLIDCDVPTRNGFTFSSSSNTAAYLQVGRDYIIGIWDTDAVIGFAISAQNRGYAKAFAGWFMRGDRFPEPARRLPSPKQAIISIHFSHDGTQLVSVLANGVIKLWDVSTGNVLQSFDAPTDFPSSAQIAGDGKLVSLSSGGKAILWNILSGKKELEFSLGEGMFWDFSPMQNGRFTRVKTRRGMSELINPCTSIFDLKTLKLCVKVESWFKYNGDDLLYIPRNQSMDFLDISSQSGNTIAFGNQSGVLVVLRMPHPPS
ncbi:hypothetical protein TWF281_003577 [Arthrobotrys megalospora]